MNTYPCESNGVMRFVRAMSAADAVKLVQADSTRAVRAYRPLSDDDLALIYEREVGERAPAIDDLIEFLGVHFTRYPEDIPSLA